MESVRNVRPINRILCCYIHIRRPIRRARNNHIIWIIRSYGIDDFYVIGFDVCPSGIDRLVESFINEMGVAAISFRDVGEELDWSVFMVGILGVFIMPVDNDVKPILDSSFDDCFYFL